MKIKQKHQFNILAKEGHIILILEKNILVITFSFLCYFSSFQKCILDASIYMYAMLIV